MWPNDGQTSGRVDKILAAHWDWKHPRKKDKHYAEWGVHVCYTLLGYNWEVLLMFLLLRTSCGFQVFGFQRVNVSLWMVVTLAINLLSQLPAFIAIVPRRKDMKLLVIQTICSFHIDTHTNITTHTKRESHQHKHIYICVFEILEKIVTKSQLLFWYFVIPLLRQDGFMYVCMGIYVSYVRDGLALRRRISSYRFWRGPKWYLRQFVLIFYLKKHSNKLPQWSTLINWIIKLYLKRIMQMWLRS